jgi:hypothetical protein
MVIELSSTRHVNAYIYNALVEFRLVFKFCQAFAGRSCVISFRLFYFDRVIGRSIKLEVASTERIAGIRDEQLFHD